MFVPFTFGITWGELDGETHPFVGLVVFDDETGPLIRCSGTLISPTVLLTAGHCTYKKTTARVWFDSDLTDNSEYLFGGTTSVGRDAQPEHPYRTCIIYGFGVEWIYIMS